MFDKLQNQKVIINTDIDGILSGLILHNFLNCEIVGFSNSWDTVWYNKNKINDINNAVYIDMYVADPEVVCIDQHVICANQEHHHKITKNSNKFNPNVANFNNPSYHTPNSLYYNKYPFGTFHYLIAALSKDSETFETNFLNIDLMKNDFINNDGLKLIDLILRADDTMNTSIRKYIPNARNWWSWLYTFSGKSSTITNMASYLYELNGAEVLKTSQKTKNLLMGDPFYCKSDDGGFKAIIDDYGFLLSNVKDYISYLSKLMGLNCFNLDMKLTISQGQAKRVSLNNFERNELAENNTYNGEKIFSYAFIFASIQPQHFSYTIM